MMNRNDFENLFYDPLLPDLVPEGPSYDELLDTSNLDMFAPHPDLTDLTRKLEALTIDSNTHSLRVEIERTKRQRLRTLVKQVKRDLTTAYTDIGIMREEINQLREQQNAVNFQLDNDNTRTSTLAFRSLSRIAQILALDLSPSLSVESRHEAEILIQELYSTIRQFGIYYTASYV